MESGRQALGLLGQSSVLFVRPDGSRVFSLQLGNLVPLREAQRSSSAIRFAAHGDRIALVQADQVVIVQRDGKRLKAVTFAPDVTPLSGNWLFWSTDGDRMTTLRKEGYVGGKVST